MTQVLPASFIPYASTTTPSFRRSPLVRAGGWCGFIALAMTGLFSPLWMSGRDVLGFHAYPPGSSYVDSVRQLVPLLQMFLLGAGLALTLAGRVQTGGKRYSGYLVALYLNLLALSALGLELSRAMEPYRAISRWIVLSSSI